MKKKAFTLIELIAVLVILAILALIVTPLVMSIIKKARISADKRSIDAYGRSIEIAIAGYLLDTGKFPNDISQLTIEYSGDRVECSTTQLNDDSSVFLEGCTVAGRSIDYTYGTNKSPTYQTYEIGDKITYKGNSYYVIKASETTDSYVTVMKEIPLTVSEVNQYGVGYINKNTPDSQGVVYDRNGYGKVAYYSSDSCKNMDYSGCTNSYDQSDVKHIVDAWSLDTVNLGLNALVLDEEGYKVRLIKFDELLENLGFELQQINPTSQAYMYTDATPEWVVLENDSYWTMSQDNDSTYRVFEASSILSSVEVNVAGKFIAGHGALIRPVVNLSKTVL